MKHSTHAYLTIIILLAVVILGAYIVFFHFLNKEIRVAAESESRILLLQAKDEDVSAQKKLIDETKEKVSKLSSYFVFEEGAPGFLETIENLDTVAGTETVIASVQVKEPAKEGDKAELYIMFDAEGTFEQVYHLLTLVETLPYEIRIENTSLARIAKPSDTDVVSVPLWRLSLSFSVVSFISST